MSVQKLEIGNSTTTGLILAFMLGVPVLTVFCTLLIFENNVSKVHLIGVGGIAFIISFTIGIVRIIKNGKYVFLGLNKDGIIYKNEPLVSWQDVKTIEIESNWLWGYNHPRELRFVIIAKKSGEFLRLNITRADIAKEELMVQINKFRSLYTE